MTLAEEVFTGGGLEGASEKQVRAILEKLQTLAVVVQHRTLPTADFLACDVGPAIVLLRNDGGSNTTTDFTDQHLSSSRSMTAVREAMAAHAAITSAISAQKDRYDAARELFLRQRIEADSVAQGGAQALAGGTL